LEINLSEEMRITDNTPMKPNFFFARKQVLFYGSLLIILVVVAGYLFLTFPHAVLDDAYIYARYAYNLSEHGNFTWNLQGDPVNGCTGILLPILYALLFKFGMGFDIQCLLVGMVSFILTGFLIWRVLFEKKANFYLAIGIYSLYLFTPVIYWNIFSGLETFLFTFFLVLSAYLFWKTLDSPKKWNVFLQFSLLFLVLSRPEGIIFVVLFDLILLYRERKQVFRSFLLLEFLLILVIPFLAYFVWQWSKFGFPLPNPYYVKNSPVFRMSTLLEIIAFFKGSVNILGIITLLICSTVLLVFNKKRMNRIVIDHSVLLTTVSSSIGTCVVMGKYLFSILQMNISDRFFVPFFVLAIFSIGLIVSDIAGKSSNDGKFRWTSIVTMVICVLIIGVNFSGNYFAEKRYAKKYLNTMQSEHIPAGLFLHEVIPANEYLVVVIDAGAIPFYSQLPTIDFGELNDAFLTHNTLTPEQRLDYLFSTNPGVIVLTGSALVNDQSDFPFTFTNFYQQIVEDTRFQNYHLEKIYGQDETLELLSNYYVFIYIRNGIN